MRTRPQSKQVLFVSPSSDAVAHLTSSKCLVLMDPLTEALGGHVPCREPEYQLGWTEQSLDPGMGQPMRPRAQRSESETLLGPP